MKRFVGSRVSMQRLSDMEMFYGWVEGFKNNELRVRVTSKNNILPRDVLQLELRAQRGAASIKVEARMFLDACVVLSLPERIQVRPPEDNMRLQLARVAASLMIGGRQHEAFIVDASPLGAGLLTSQSLDPGTPLQLTVQTDQGPMTASGTVVYCEMRTDQENEFRMGLRFDPLPRLSKARWDAVLDVPA